jgi:hypothetical protein
MERPDHTQSNAWHHLIAVLLLFVGGGSLRAQPLCNAAGNVVIFSNYDGGALTINVNVNIPNLKIGICSYEFSRITITGPFAGNVTAVRYIGFNANNGHCGLSMPFTSTITGVPAGITSFVIAPPAPLANPNGWNSMICAYSCSTTSNQGGCNTVDQVSAYFMGVFGGALRFHRVQYGCWGNQSISAGGNCCIGIPLPVELLHFEGRQRGDRVELDWATASETNSAYFDVVRLDGNEGMYSVGSLPAAGNSQQMIQYGLLDQEPRMGINHYQLREVDLDGQEQLSDIIAVPFELQSDGGFVVIPSMGGGVLVQSTIDLQQTIMWHLADGRTLGSFVLPPQGQVPLLFKGPSSGVQVLRSLEKNTVQRFIAP